MSKARILIVEDEAIIAMELESQLQSLGYDVTSVVNTGEKAIQKAETDKPDLILMDIRIQGDKDGIETAEIIRNRFGIPIIFSTAYLDQERIERAKITMPFGYVLKPIQERDLKVTLEMALYVTKVDAKRYQVEEELMMNRDLLNQTGSIAKIGGWEVDLQTMEPQWTEEVRKVFEVEKVPPVEKGVDFYAPESRPIIQEAFDELLKNEKPYDLKLRVITVKGKSRFIRTTGKIIHDKSGKAVKAVGIVQDISDLKKSEDSLMHSEERFHLVFEYANIGICLVGMDGQLLRVNSQMTKILGYSQAELEDMTVNDIAHQDDLNISLQYIQEAKAGEAEHFQFEKRYIHKNGEIIWGQVSISLVRGLDGELSHFISHIQDVTKRKRAEEELLEQKLNLERSQHVAKVGSWEWDIKSNCIKWSKEMYSIFGIDEEAISPTVDEYSQMIHPDDLSNVLSREAFEKNTKEKRNEMEYRIIDQSTKQAKWVHLWADNIFDEKGNVVRITGVLQNITERKQAEEITRKNEEKFRLLYERAPLSYQSLDANGCFKEVNDAWLNTLGYAKEEVIGKSFGDFIHPEWKDHFKENFPRFKKIGEVLGVEFKMKKKDGSLILVSFTGKIGYDVDGNFKQTHCVFKDITSQKQLEKNLCDNETRYRRLVSNLKLLICELDEKGVYTYINENYETILGRRPDELVGCPAAELLHPDDLELAGKKFKILLEDKNCSHHVWRFRHKDGRYLQFECSGSVFLNEEGEQKTIVMSRCLET